LKVLIASGAGLTASSLVPPQWTKPLVNTGVMPVHAQTSVLVYYLAATDSGTQYQGNITINSVQAFVSSEPIASSYNTGAHAKLAAPARNGFTTGVPNITVTMTIRNVDSSNVPTFANPTGATRQEITSSTFPIGYADFGNVEIHFSQPGNPAEFYLVFNAPHCEEVTLHYTLGGQ